MKYKKCLWSWRFKHLLYFRMCLISQPLLRLKPLPVFSKRFQKIFVFLHCSPHIYSMVLEFKSNLVRFSISRFCGLAILLRWWVTGLNFDWTCSISDGGCPSIILPFKAFCCEPADTSGNDECWLKASGGVVRVSSWMWICSCSDILEALGDRWQLA